MKIRQLLTACALLTAALPLSAGERLLPPVQKKIIAFGWDNPTPEYLDKNLEQIETFAAPHDGVGINIAKTITLPSGKKDLNTYYNFSKIRYSRDWYKKDIEHLKRVHARAKVLKYNFLKTPCSSFTREFDFYDDEFWNIVCEKYATFAWIAKQGGCAGIEFDLEDYGNQQLWKYRPACGHTYAEAWDKARERGRQWMSAIVKEYPDITFFACFWLDLMMGYADGSPNLFERLEGCSTGLQVPFINGIYDVLPPKAKIVDGMEGYGYFAYELNHYYRLRALREERYHKLLAPENQRKFREQSSLACATFMSCYTNPKQPYSFRELMKKANMTPLEYFRRNFTWAVQYSDEYVWTWTETRKWIPPAKYKFAWQEKIAAAQPCPGPYNGMALPGVEEAMRYAKDPWKYAYDFLKNNKNKKNLLNNPGFEGASANRSAGLAPDSKTDKALPGWESWQRRRSKGSFSLAKGQGINGSNALLIKGVESGCTHQSVKIDPNSVYIVRACARVSGKAAATLLISWRNKKGAWSSGQLNLSSTFNEDIGNGWKRATVVIRSVPEDTAFLTPQLYVHGRPEDSVLFDNVEVFSFFSDKGEVAPHLKAEMAKWTAAQNSAETFKKAKKSQPVKGNLVTDGAFNAAGDPVTDFTIAGGSLYKTKCQTYGKGKCFTVAGKNMGFADETAGVIMKNGAMFLCSVGGVKPGEKYKVCVKAKPVGKAVPKVYVYWISPRKKPFDYALGVPAIPCGKKLANGWIPAEGVITVPAPATGFMILSEARNVTGNDMVFFDDIQAFRMQ